MSVPTALQSILHDVVTLSLMAHTAHVNEADYAKHLLLERVYTEAQSMVDGLAETILTVNDGKYAEIWPNDEMSSAAPTIEKLVAICEDIEDQCKGNLASEPLAQNLVLDIGAKIAKLRMLMERA